MDQTERSNQTKQEKTTGRQTTDMHRLSILSRNIKTLQPHRGFMTFEGHLVSNDIPVTDEEKLTRIFGGRLKGESPKPKSTSRYLVANQSRIIAGVKVPHRPIEPDNCCMSGCVNCVWEYFNEDIREWQQRRRATVKAISQTHDVWPADWEPPISLLKMENLPESLHKKKLIQEQEKEKQSGTQLKNLFPTRSTPLPQSVIEAKKRNLAKRQQMEAEENDGWSEVPIYIKAFAQFERKKRLQRQKEKLERRAKEASATI
ncbi:hypothetical protein MOSE0_N04588 [Monosporozyma servazzii]